MPKWISFHSALSVCGRHIKTYGTQNVCSFASFFVMGNISWATRSKIKDPEFRWLWYVKRSEEEFTPPQPAISCASVLSQQWHFQAFCTRSSHFYPSTPTSVLPSSEILSHRDRKAIHPSACLTFRLWCSTWDPALAGTRAFRQRRKAGPRRTAEEGLHLKGSLLASSSAGMWPLLPVFSAFSWLILLCKEEPVMFFFFNKCEIAKLVKF